MDPPLAAMVEATGTEVALLSLAFDRMAEGFATAVVELFLLLLLLPPLLLLLEPFAAVLPLLLVPPPPPLDSRPLPVVFACPLELELALERPIFASLATELELPAAAATADDDVFEPDNFLIEDGGGGVLERTTPFPAPPPRPSFSAPFGFVALLPGSATGAREVDSDGVLDFPTGVDVLVAAPDERLLDVPPPVPPDRLLVEVPLLRRLPLPPPLLPTTTARWLSRIRFAPRSLRKSRSALDGLGSSLPSDSLMSA